MVVGLQQATTCPRRVPTTCCNLTKRRCKYLLAPMRVVLSTLAQHGYCPTMNLRSITQHAQHSRATVTGSCMVGAMTLPRYHCAVPRQLHPLQAHAIVKANVVQHACSCSLGSLSIRRTSAAGRVIPTTARPRRPRKSHGQDWA